MSIWEHRGYLTYPNHYGKPRPGTNQELEWSRGWEKAQREEVNWQKSDWHLALENDYWAGRDTYAVAYWDKK